MASMFAWFANTYNYSTQAVSDMHYVLFAWFANTYNYSTQAILE